MVKACIFDLDGVIVDTAKYHYLAWKRLAQEAFQYNLTEEENERLKGVSRMESLEIILQLANKTLDMVAKEKFASLKNTWYVELISKMTPAEILPGSIEFLELIRKHNIKTAVGSASKNAIGILEHIKLKHYFDAIIDGYQVTNPKPHPEIFLKAAKALAVSPRDCVVFEDALVGIEAALTGNMHCIGVGSSKILGKADRVVASLQEMRLEYLNF